MRFKHLICTIENNVATVTIDHPPVNALNADVYRDLHDVMDELEENKKVRAIILTGKGEKAFAAGADVKEMAEKNIKDLNQMNKRSRAAYSKIENLSKPVIAAINGLALGGGLELVLACDLRISSDTARFSFPEVGLGIIPGGGGTQRLQKIVGQGIAKELIYFGDMFDAKKAQELQLVNKVVPGAELTGEAYAWAEKLAEKPAVALEMAKLAIHQGREVDTTSGLIMETTAFATAFSSEDAKEGLSAFVDKRKPKFSGK